MLIVSLFYCHYIVQSTNVKASWEQQKCSFQFCMIGGEVQTLNKTALYHLMCINAITHLQATLKQWYHLSSLSCVGSWATVASIYRNVKVINYNSRQRCPVCTVCYLKKVQDKPSIAMTAQQKKCSSLLSQVSGLWESTVSCRKSFALVPYPPWMGWVLHALITKCL